MPELPEIETLKNQITPVVVNKQIVDFIKSDKKLRRIIPDISSLKYDSIVNTYRRNKYLILETSNHWLIFHLGMTGQLTHQQNQKLNKHTHLKLKFSDNSYLQYDDARRFGSIDFFSKQQYPDYLEIPILKKLGVEPLNKEFNKKKLIALAKQSSIEIKKFLMNSDIISGIGNIYANEILFLSKINPWKITKTITDQEAEILQKNIKLVLKKAIDLGGSSISDFVHLNGFKGSMQENYYVYGRENLPCKVCNHLIKREKQSGRSTFYCPFCQKQ